MISLNQKQLFSVITIFLVAIVIALGFSTYFYFLMRPFNSIGTRIEGDLLFEDDKEVGFIASKNSSSHVIDINKEQDFYVYTDKQRARRNHRNFESPEKVDIMGIGGSFTWGHGIQNENTFLEVLGKDLDVSVANFALASYGTLQSLQLLERHIHLNPKVIIYGFISDHIQRNLKACAPSISPFCRYVSYVDFDKQDVPYIHPPKGQYSKNFIKRFHEDVIRNPSIFGNISWGMKLFTYKMIGKNKFSYLKDDIHKRKSLIYLVNRMHQVARKINASLIILFIPPLEREANRQPPQALLQSLNKDIIFINLGDFINHYYKDPAKPLLRFKMDDHPNELAHKIMADEIRNALQRKEIF